MKLPENEQTFTDTYYYREDLVKICKEYGLASHGSKQELTDRIALFIRTGAKDTSPAPRKSRSVYTYEQIMPSAVIDPNYSNTEDHRRFFTDRIGSSFKFNIPFMEWMKANKGSATYAQAIDEWHCIYRELQAGKKQEISVQCKYNQYTRDFFAANPDKTKADCIKCWNSKKSRPGRHVYESSDLHILEE